MAKNRQEGALPMAIAAIDAGQRRHKQHQTETCDLAIPVLCALSTEDHENGHNPDGKKPLAIRIDDGPHDAATRAEADAAEPVEEKAPSLASPTSFVGRLMRGVSMKRELNAQIARLQQEMKQRQHLVEKYQEGIIAPAKQLLERDALELRHTHESLLEEMKATLVRMADEGESRERMDRYRSLQLLKLQRNRILQSRAELHHSILQTRSEECDWMNMAIGSAYQQEISTLLTASASVSALQQAQTGDASGHNAINKVAIEADDPFFASAETLFQTHAESTQLQLQLNSVERLVETTQTRLEECERRPLPALNPTARSIQKQSSSQRAQTMQGILASVVSASRQASTTAVGSRRLSGCRRPRNHDFQDSLNAFQRLASDKRTRTGRLMAAYGRKLAEDARSHVQLSIGQPDEGVLKPANGSSGDDLYLPSADFVLLEAASSSCAGTEQSILDTVLAQLGDAFASPTDAVNLKMLPPPVSIVAFARFMRKTIVAEYTLEQFQNESTSPKIGTEKLKPIDLKAQKAALEACVHYFVFSQLANIGFAYAFSGYLTTEVNRKIDVDEAVEQSLPLLQTWHWKHSKRAIQQIPLAQLAFPSGALKRVESAVQSPQDESSGLLQQSLQSFRAIESETTPLGVVNRVMEAFKVLHDELYDLLEMPNRQQRNQSAGTFLNADVLIPSLVLMMSRLEHESDLDHLWRQVNLVKAFQRPLLIEDGEEAYYLTCLLAAMEFVQTYKPDPSLQQPLSIARKECSECRALAARLRISEPKAARSKSFRSSSALPANLSDEEAVRQLSTWISGQASVESASHRSGSEFERWVYTAR